MDWNDFFERTRVAAKVESYSKLAPLLGITDGAIGHYRMGRRVPQVWVVADALRIQGHPEPEKQAIEIMKRAALTSPERTFWKRLAATAMALCLAVGFALPHKAQAAVPGFDSVHAVYIMRNEACPAQAAPLGCFRRFCLAMAVALARLLPACSFPRQG
ncbi:Phage related protein [Stenotrophomonas sp. RIT309]|uniref:DUF3693 domain-containing protein n=1 Tax=Stenotrophomonas sp. RIT309 TaxID=1470590 RepID=UPI0004486EF3|nr:DUF3693 domain-containing protein [Stenotrophomonas sp. RIT309]EZP47882.1 Phage related protein [Stenotrophomonas sp. RIT309]